MSSPTDKGALFKLTDRNSGVDLRVLFRKRSNTFPSASNNIDLYNDFNVDNDSEFEDDHYDSPFQMDSPQKRPINANNVHNSITKSVEYRAVLSDSPKSPIKPLNNNNESTPNYMQHQYHYNNQWDNTCSPQSMHSLIPSLSSPLMATIPFFNGMHMPVRPYVNYPGIYSSVYGNSMFDRNLQSSPHLDPFSHLDRIAEMAKSHRNAATHADARHTWSGTLPNNAPNKTPVYSCKVFLGGVPWEMGDHDIKLTFSRFGNVNILRPGQHVRLSRTSQNKDKAGYLYLIFESDKQVKSLLNACTHDFSNGGKYYYALNQPRYRPKDVQIIPWNVNDTSYVKSPSARVDANKTVFVGALHGMLTAEGLACILEDLFGGVVYVGIDTDKYKYPIGSGRVTFSTSKAYTRAVQAGFIDVKASRFQKKIQIDPFLEESNCSNCRTNKGPIFCRDTCMRYLCRVCWDILHASDNMKCHQPIMRNKSKF